MGARYHFVQAESQEGLIALVNQMLADDWLLQGGIGISVIPNGNVRYAQALIKIED